jgi:hypothetical protein
LIARIFAEWMSGKKSMTTLPLIFKHGHLFVELEGQLWLFDTGAPESFGAVESLQVANEQFTLSSSYFGLTPQTLSQYIGVECSGLLGADVLNRFDHILDIKAATLAISTTELSHHGQRVHLDEFMGIPIVTATVGGREYRMFFDTGAHISYFQEESLADFPPAGSVTDFYPGVGQFQTDTHEVAMALRESPFLLRCGRLPGFLGATLMMADTQGIIGNQVLNDRVAGFFPRRGMLFL